MPGRFGPMMLDHDTIPARAPGATLVEADGASMLLDRETGALHLLNEAGVEIWGRVDGSRSVAAIIAELSEAFGAERSGVEGDVARFLTDLGDLGLVEGVNGGTHPETRQAGRASASVIPDGLSASVDAVWVDWYAAQVIETLRNEGVESVLLKGPAIRRWLYRGAPSARSYLDADLLVPTGQLGAAAAILSELGFRREDPRGMEPINLWATSWRRPSDGAVIDLHRTLHGCEHSTVDVWPLVRKTAVREEVGGSEALLPSIPVRVVQVVLISPADRPWRRWDDLERIFEQVPSETWREAAHVAKALGVERLFGYRLSQSAAGTVRAEELGLETAPRWWLRWEADPMLRWLVLLATLPGWRQRFVLARQLALPTPSYVRFRDPGAVNQSLARSYLAWVGHVFRLLPGAVRTLARSLRRRWARD